MNFQDAMRDVEIPEFNMPDDAIVTDVLCFVRFSIPPSADDEPQACGHTHTAFLSIAATPTYDVSLQIGDVQRWSDALRDRARGEWRQPNPEGGTV